MADEHPKGRKPSSWAAAISQLPGYPVQDLLRMPELPAARKVTSRLDDDEDDDREDEPQQRT